MMQEVCCDMVKFRSELSDHNGESESASGRPPARNKSVSFCSAAYPMLIHEHLELNGAERNAHSASRADTAAPPAANGALRRSRSFQSARSPGSPPRPCPLHDPLSTSPLSPLSPRLRRKTCHSLPLSPTASSGSGSRRISSEVLPPLPENGAAESFPKEGASSCLALKKAVSELYNLDDFNLVKIGEGFFSEVFKVAHKTSGKVMVLKMNKLRRRRWSTGIGMDAATAIDTSENSMLKELQLMNLLKHENILKYEAACVHEGQLHVLTEFVNGGSLDQLVSDSGRTLAWPTRLRLAVHVAKGMAYLHSKGFLHRDLTSKNILVRKDDTRRGVLSAVVADFGLATRQPDEGSQERLAPVGSPYWMAPECLKGEYYAKEADVFSFGIILCELIAAIDADPDQMPRTDNFGVDYNVFARLVSRDCPAKFFRTALTCVQILPGYRPSFNTLQLDLELLLNELGIESKKQQQLCPEDKSSSSGCHEKTATPTEADFKAKQRAAAGFSTRANKSIGEHNRRKAHLSPSDKARLHSVIPPNAANPLLGIASEVAAADPHYVPLPASPAPVSSLKLPNPFLSLFGGHQEKILPDLYCSCFEAALAPDEPGPIRGPRVRKAVSLVHRDPEGYTFEFSDEIMQKLRLCDDQRSDAMPDAVCPS